MRRMNASDENRRPLAVIRILAAISLLMPASPVRTPAQAQGHTATAPSEELEHQQLEEEFIESRVRNGQSEYLLAALNTVQFNPVGRDGQATVTVIVR